MTHRLSSFALGVLIALGVASCATPHASTRKPGATADRAPSETMVVDLGARQPNAQPLARQVLPGTGPLVQPPPAEEPATTPVGDGFQLNFVDTDISSIVSEVLGDGLGVPFVVDPQVKGNMSLQATRALSRDEVLAALETALRAQGFVLVAQNGVYHVVPNKDASRRITRLQSAGQGARGYGIYVVPLQFVSADEMEKVLQPFAPDGGILRVDEARNLLLLAGTGQEIETLLSVVKTFDVDWLAGMSFGLYPLEYVDAKTLAGELSEVFAGPRSPIATVVRFVPLARLNALMVITPQAKYLQDVEAWIKRLDLGATTPGRRIYVYDVQNGKADDLARSLGRILSISGDWDRGGASTGSSFGNSSPFSDSPFSTGGLSSSSSGNTSVGGGLASRASRSVPAPQNDSPSANLSRSGDAASSSALDAGALKIVPNEENNSLLILASPSEFGIIDAALKRLDVLPIQVLIEASIAEVTLTDDIRYGLQYSWLAGDGPVVLSGSGTGAISPAFPGFSYLYTGTTNIRAVLNAIESLTTVRVISAPKLVVLNNREAQLQVGDQVPISTQSSIGTNDPSSPIVNSIQLRDTGVILRVTPRANKSGRVILEVAQEVSDVAKTTSSGIDSPTIQQRKIASTVAVRDGDTIALGGLIRDTQSNGGDGIPYLRRIPILGHVFGSTDRGSRRTELIVLLTPHVIRSAEESDEVMDELRKQFKGLRKAWPARLESATPPPANVPANAPSPQPPPPAIAPTPPPR
ncbi:MAG: type II secretion system secretin GspD [Gammaproteobacteria bacterium]